MSDTVRLLSLCLANPGAGFSRRHFREKFGDDTQALVELGIFSAPVSAPDIDCPCPEGHPAVPRWIAVKTEYHVSCYRGRTYRLDALDVEVHAFNAQGFRNTVAEALGLAKPNRSSQSGGPVRYAGDALFGTTRFPILFIDDLWQPEQLDGLLLANTRQTGHTRGLILTSEPPVERLRADSLHAIVTPDDVLDFEDGCFRKRPHVLRSLLKDVIKKMPAAESEALVRGVALDYRDGHRAWPSARMLEALAAGRWPEDQEPPGKSTCNKVLRALKVRNA